MKHHRFAEIWPLMTGSDFEELKADIATYGQRMPIVTYKGEVLDGRNRERACEELGITPRYEEAPIKSDEEALDLVVSLNQHRRHLSVEERAFAAARLANVRQGSNQFRNKKDTSVEVSSNSATTTLREAADKINVSYGSAERARAILNHGTDEDVKEVLAGKVSLGAKADRLRPPRRPSKDKGKSTSRERKSPRLVIVNPGPLRSLTREEVDPEFTGTGIEWVDKYGHVQVMTAAEYATMRFGAWAANVRSLARLARDLPDWPTVDHNWLRQPKAADIGKLADALTFLRPKLAEAEKLLERAQAAIEQKQTA